MSPFRELPECVAHGPKRASVRYFLPGDAGARQWVVNLRPAGWQLVSSVGKTSHIGLGVRGDPGSIPGEVHTSDRCPSWLTRCGVGSRTLP